MQERERERDGESLQTTPQQKGISINPSKFKNLKHHLCIFPSLIHMRVQVYRHTITFFGIFYNPDNSQLTLTQPPSPQFARPWTLTNNLNINQPKSQSIQSYGETNSQELGGGLEWKGKRGNEKPKSMHTYTRKHIWIKKNWKKNDCITVSTEGYIVAAVKCNECNRA